MAILQNNEHKIVVPDLDIERIFDDYPYYCEKLLRIKTKSKGIAPLAFNNIQRLIWFGKPPDFETNRIYQYTRLDEGMWEKLKRGEPLRYIVLKYRQAGVSTFFTSFAFWRTHTNPGHNSLIVAHDLKTTKHLFNDMCKVYYQFLDHRVKPRTNTKNMYELEFKDPKGGLGLESIISTATAGHVGSGHGHTFHTLCLSEMSRWPNWDSLEGLTQTVPTGEDSEGTSIIIESVAKVSGDLFNHKYDMAVARESDYTPLFLPWYLHNEYRERFLPTGFEMKEYWKDFRDAYALDERQVWWYYKKYRELEDENPGRGLDKIKMLYPGNENEAWMTTGESAFPTEALEYLATKMKPPIASGEYIGDMFSIHSHTKGKLQIWEKPRGDVLYCIGVDIALGVGESESVAIVLAHPGYRQVASWSDNRTDPKKMAYILKALGEYYNNALIAVEINNAGILTNATLDDIYTCGNIYEWEYFNKRGNTKTKSTGWQTSQESKRLLLGQANSLLKGNPPEVEINSPILLSQMKNFIDYGNEVFQPAKGCRSDHVMSWLIGIMAMWRKIARFEDFRDRNEPISKEDPMYTRGIKDDWDLEDLGDTKGEKDWMLL